MTTINTAHRPTDVEPSRAARALLFAWDGVLFDNRAFAYRVLGKVLAAHGAAIDERWFEQHRDLPMADIVTMACRRAAVDIDPHVIITERNRLAIKNGHQLRPNTLVHTLIHRFRGLLPIGIVTSSHRSAIQPAMRTFHLDTAMRVAVTRDQLVRDKPHPDGYLLACRRIAVEPGNVWVYEATDHGIAAAVAAGVAHVVDIRPLYQVAGHSAKESDRLLDFARRWEPFGGPPAEDLMVQFGLTPAMFSERVARLY